MDDDDFNRLLARVGKVEDAIFRIENRDDPEQVEEPEGEGMEEKLSWVNSRLERIDRRLEYLGAFACGTTAVVVGFIAFHTARNWYASYGNAMMIALWAFAFAAIYVHNKTTQ